ncbi:hypothetical protein [Glaciimonas sp. PCH181]|uniref:hypothetical protein n=1 Tax=Glaciimonas sp. PCH181 TaxID=2133943 RepID=UPI000D37EE8D|nr:hypothetical protein [Glaciimonas sp. PCH181]PUA18840.1 hypothetical protein C7W93_02690 [Glaciimonas sp. PCH181]
MQKIDLNRFQQRLKWEWYRVAGGLGLPGISACGILVVALIAHQAFLKPTINQQQNTLTRITAQQVANTKKIHNSRNVVSKVGSLSSAGQQDVLDLAKKYALDTREVKYQQIQRGKKGAAQDSRILITLPTAGSYALFRDLSEELAGLPGVWVETFSLTRKTPSEVMLEIEMKLSVTKPASNDVVKNTDMAKSKVTHAEVAK